VDDSAIAVGRSRYFSEYDRICLQEKERTIMNHEDAWAYGAILSGGRTYRDRGMGPYLRVNCINHSTAMRLAKTLGEGQLPKKINNKFPNTREVRVKNLAESERILAATGGLKRVPSGMDYETRRVFARGAFEVKGQMWFSYDVKKGESTPFVLQPTSQCVFKWLKADGWTLDYGADPRRVAHKRRLKTADQRYALWLKNEDAIVYLDWLYGNDIAPDYRDPVLYKKYKSLISVHAFLSYDPYAEIVNAVSGTTEKVSELVRDRIAYYDKYVPKELPENAVLANAFMEAKKKHEARNQND
jgi:hypothetical protein